MSASIRTALAIEALAELEAAAASLRKLLLHVGGKDGWVPVSAFGSDDFIRETSRLMRALARGGVEMEAWARTARVEATRLGVAP